MKSIVSIKDSAVLTAGLFPSLPKAQDALWRDGNNVRFSKSGARKSEGWLKEPLSETAGAYSVTQLAQSYNAGERRVYYGLGRGVNAVRLWTDGYVRSLGSGFGSGEWSFTTWGNFLLATNHVDPVKVWKNGTPDLENLAGLSAEGVTRAKIVKKLSNHVLLYNTNLGGNEIRWCSLSDIETWASTSLTTAGFFQVRDFDGDVEGVVEFGEYLAFFSQDSMGITQYTGSPSYFTHKVILNGIGLVGKDAGAPVGKEIYGLGQKGFWRTDGFTFSYVDTPAVRDFYESVRLKAGRARSVAFHNEADKCVEWYFEQNDSSIVGLAFYYETGAWTKLGFAVTAAIEQQVLDYPLVGIGKAFAYYGQGQNADTAAFTANLRSAIYDGGSRDYYKWWEMLRMDVEGNPESLSVRFGFADTLVDGDLAWTDWQAFERENWIPDGPRESRFFAFEIQSTASAQTWKVTALDILGDKGARF